MNGAAKKLDRNVQPTKEATIFGMPVMTCESLDADTVVLTQNGKVVGRITNLANDESPQPKPGDMSTGANP